MIPREEEGTYFGISISIETVMIDVRTTNGYPMEINLFSIWIHSRIGSWIHGHIGYIHSDTLLLLQTLFVGYHNHFIPFCLMKNHLRIQRECRKAVSIMHSITKHLFDLVEKLDSFFHLDPIGGEKQLFSDLHRDLFHHYHLHLFQLLELEWHRCCGFEWLFSLDLDCIPFSTCHCFILPHFLFFHFLFVSIACCIHSTTTTDALFSFVLEF